MDEHNASIFTHAKMEYTNQLIDVLTPQLFDGIKSIYDEAKKVNNINNQPILVLFRKFLEKVPSWSNVILEGETERIIKLSNCDWIDDLITAVFISHTKILTCIGTNISNNNIDLTIPKTINFIHKTYINVAREIWKNPYLYNENVNASEYQQNMRTVELIIKESIETTIRILLPIKDILKNHLDAYDTSNYEAQKKLASSDLRQMLFDEIKSLNLGKLLSQNIDNDYVKVNPSEEENIIESDEEEKNINGNLNEDNNDEFLNEDNNDEKLNEDNNDEIENNDKFLNKENNSEENAEKVIEPIEQFIETVDDYESPDEEEIKKSCSNLEINTIPDVTEEKYDNVDIVEKEEKKDLSLLETFIQSLSNTKKKEKLEKERLEKDRLEKQRLEQDRLEKERLEKERLEKERLEQDRLKKQRLEKERLEKERLEKERLEKERLEKERLEKDRLEQDRLEKEENLIKDEEKDTIEPLKEIITVPKMIDDTETVDDFYNDVSKLMENKGINVDKNVKSYTLFDDAAEKEF